MLCMFAGLLATSRDQFFANVSIQCSHIYVLIPFYPIHSTSVQYWEISFSTLKPLWDYHHRLLDCDGVSPGAVFAKEPLLRRFPTPQTPSRTLLISTCLPQNCHVGTFHGSSQQTEAVSRFKHFEAFQHFSSFFQGHNSQHGKQSSATASAWMDLPHNILHNSL